MKLFSKGKYAGLHNLDFGIKEGDKVLDVGGAYKPFSQSTHVADFIDHEEQRHGKSLNIGKRQLIEGDVCETLENFSDNYFDFCYSSHTFEHIENLPKALDEISRTCKRGFYALPGSDFELFTAQPHFGHVNLCRQIGNTLHICERPNNSVLADMGFLFSQLWQHPKFQPLWEEKYRYIWEIRYVWNNEIKYQFHNDPEDLYPQLKYFGEKK